MTLTRQLLRMCSTVRAGPAGVAVLFCFVFHSNVQWGTAQAKRVEKLCMSAGICLFGVEASESRSRCAACPAGHDAWLNPVEPKLPDDYTPGELHLASDKAAQAVIAAAVAAGLPQPKVIVKTN